MQAILEGMNAGLKIPNTGLKSLASLTAILVSGILSAIIFQVGNPGSAVALCFAIPAILVLQSWFAQSHSLRANLLPAMTGISLLGVAIEPGILNVVLTWCLLSAMAIIARGLIDVLPLPLLAATARNFFSGPRLLFVDSQSAAHEIHNNAGHIPRPPIASLVLPLVAVGIFTLLLASANPVIEKVLLTLHFEQPLHFIVSIFDALFSWSGLVFFLTALLLWPVLRGQTKVRETVINLEGVAPLWHRLFFRPATVVVTLLLLNFLFATENALDIWHVWMKAALPDGMTHAAYVHRGSYTLIATAILAAMLMVFALWKGSETEQSSMVRKLVYLWTAQNLLLVASSAKRTLEYIDAYGWTEWRLAGLLWMGLVFFGLASIICRVATDRDSRWLLNINLVAACALLLLCGSVDMRGFIARQNLDINLIFAHRQIDFDYVSSLDPPALPALVNFEKQLRLQLDEAGRPTNQVAFRNALSQTRLIKTVLQSQKYKWSNDWRSWTWRYAGLAAESNP